MNHLISEMLPENGADPLANADPVTGQAAWYDLRVRIEKTSAAEAGRTAPSFAPLHHPPSLPPPPDIVRYGGDFGGDRQQRAAE